MDPGTIEATFKAGTEVTFEILMHAHHRGVFEFSICDLKDVDNGQETFECFNRHRLMRSPNDDSVSPIDPLYPKRYYLEPYCAFETYTKAVGCHACGLRHCASLRAAPPAAAGLACCLTCCVVPPP